MGITKAQDIVPNQNFEQLDLEITSKGEVRSFANQKGSGKVCNAAAKDDTAEIKITLWNEQCDQFEEGDKIVIKDGWVSEYNGEKQVSTGRNGSIEKKE
tara:strand:- start:365 stop:661 length:297 start_codon:yes stop_codon:yes gene_type:complete